MELLENAECCGSLGVCTCGQKSRHAQELLQMARHLLTATEIEGNCVNARGIDNNEFVIEGTFGITAPAQWCMTRLDPEPDISKDC